MPLTASYIETCKMARARDARGGGVRSTRMASRAAEFHCVTTSARTTAAELNTARHAMTRGLPYSFISSLLECDRFGLENSAALCNREATHLSYGSRFAADCT